MDNNSLNRLLHEAQGKCWHEWEYYYIEDDNSVDSGHTCKKCHIDSYGIKKIDYSTWKGFALLYPWMIDDSLHSGKCKACGGTGKEICNNPDHRFIEVIPGDISRIGCPLCGHDPQHIIKNSTCPTCSGSGEYRVEVTCWECEGRPPYTDNLEDLKLMPREPEATGGGLEPIQCPTCHGSGKVKLRGWTYRDFLWWLVSRDYQGALSDLYSSKVADIHEVAFENIGPALPKVLAEFLMTLVIS